MEKKEDDNNSAVAEPKTPEEPKQPLFEEESVVIDRGILKEYAAWVRYLVSFFQYDKCPFKNKMHIRISSMRKTRQEDFALVETPFVKIDVTRIRPTAMSEGGVELRPTFFFSNDHIDLSPPYMHNFADFIDLFCGFVTSENRTGVELDLVTPHHLVNNQFFNLCYYSAFDAESSVLHLALDYQSYVRGMETKPLSLSDMETYFYSYDGEVDSN